MGKPCRKPERMPTHHLDKFLHFSIIIGYHATAMTGNSGFSRFALYGEDNGVIAPEFLHIEPISTRSSRYEWTIRPHTHPGIFQIIFLAQGAGRLVADGVARELNPAGLVAIPSGSVHAFDFAAGAEGWVLSIASALVNELTIGPRAVGRGIGAMRTAAFAPQLPDKAAQRMSWLLAQIAEDFVERGAGNVPESMLATLALLLALGGEYGGAALLSATVVNFRLGTFGIVKLVLPSIGTL